MPLRAPQNLKKVRNRLHLDKDRLMQEDMGHLFGNNSVIGRFWPKIHHVFIEKDL